MRLHLKENESQLLIRSVIQNALNLDWHDATLQCGEQLLNPVHTLSPVIHVDHHRRSHTSCM